MEKWLPFAPHILGFFALFASGAFFSFVLSILKINRKAREKKERHQELYEVAYRRAEADARALVSFAVAVCSAHKAAVRKPATVAAFLDILCDRIGKRDEGGEWRAHAFPDYLKQAHEELGMLDVQQGEEEATGEGAST